MLETSRLSYAWDWVFSSPLNQIIINLKLQYLIQKYNLWWWCVKGSHAWVEVERCAELTRWRLWNEAHWAEGTKARGGEMWGLQGGVKACGLRQQRIAGNKSLHTECPNLEADKKRISFLKCKTKILIGFWHTRLLIWFKKLWHTCSWNGWYFMPWEFSLAQQIFIGWKHLWGCAARNGSSLYYPCVGL